MKNVRRAAAATIVVLCLACSSSSNPSAQDAYNQFIGAYCDAIANCCNSGQLMGTSNLALACAGGAEAGAMFDAQACRTRSAMTVSGTEACSQDKVNACLNDIKNESCSALDPSTVTFPSSCNGC